MRDRFLGRRVTNAVEKASATVAVSAQQITALVAHAAALADRVEALPPPADADGCRAREERVRRLREAVTAGQRALRRAPGRERHQETGSSSASAS